MIWLYILIYFLGAIITGLCIYTSYVKEYKREKTAIKFSYWIEDKYETIFMSSLFWAGTLPVFIITYLLKKIIERINKHYNIG